MNGKRILSFILALVMVLGMIPFNALPTFAAEVTDATAAVVGDTIAVQGSTATPANSNVAGTHWEGPVKSASTTCGKMEHSHSDDCYDPVLSCDHTHVQGCYTSYERCYTGGVGCSHDFHYYDTNGAFGARRYWGSSTLTCDHTHVDSCYSVGTELGEGCPTRSWRNGNVLEGDFGGWQFYEHDHTEPGCYTYTWTLAWNVYDVNVTINNNTEGVTAIDVPAKGTHSKDVTFKLSATGDPYNTWTAKIGDKTFVLSATEPTTVTAYGITSGNIVVDLTSEEVPTYSVALEQNTLEGCGAAFAGDHVDLLPGAKVELNVTIPAPTAAVVYSYVVEVTGATYTKDGDKITVTVGEANATVKITYSVKKLDANTTVGNVEFNPSKTAANQADLKTAIFNAVVNSGASLPEGITVDDVVIQYYPWCDIGGIGVDANGQRTGYTDSLLSIDALTENNGLVDEDDRISHTYYNFGERFINGGDATEKVRITGTGKWAGLYVETEITLKHDHVPNIAAADCDTAKVCTVCGETLEAAKGHTAGTPVTENNVAPDCENEGSYDTVVYCTVCGEEQSRVTTTVDALGHTAGTPVTENNVAPDCENDGSYDTVVYCTVCGGEVSRVNTTVDAPGHTEATREENKTDSTCSAEGSYDLVTYCSVCNEELNRENKTIAKKPHTEATRRENEDYGNCGEEGHYDLVTYCSVCNHEISRTPVTVPATGNHTPNEAVKENVVAPDCDTDGSYDLVVKCAVCGHEISRTHTVDPKTGHTEATREENKVDSTCHSEGSYDLVTYCSVCNEELNRETKTIAKKPHTPAAPAIENNVAPDCENDGSYETVVYCSVAECRHEISRVKTDVPATGHGKQGYNYVKVDNEKHDLICKTCGETAGQEAHNFVSHLCKCGAVETFTITWVVYGETYTTTVEYGDLAVAPAYTLPEHLKFVKWDVDPVEVTGAATYTAELTLKTKNDPITINKWYTGNSDEKALENLRHNVLTAAGLDPNGNYVVTTEVGLKTERADITATVQINADGIVLVNSNAVVDGLVSAAGGAGKAFSMLLDNDTSRTFTITLPADGNKPAVVTTVSLQIKDSRNPATVAHNSNKYTASALAGIDLNTVLGNLTSNANISAVEWLDAATVLVPGQENTVKIVVTLDETDKTYVENGGKYEVEITIVVPHAQATITVPSTAVMNYNTGMSNYDKATGVWEALNPQFTPAGGTYTYEVFYKANVARTVELVINIDQLDLGMWNSILKTALGTNIVKVPVTVQDKWLNIGTEIVIPEAPSNERLEEILLNDLIPNYATQALAGNLDVQAALTKTLNKYPDIKEYYEWLGAHYFGENETKDADGNVLETVYVQVKDYTVNGENYGELGGKVNGLSVLTLKDTRKDTELKLNAGLEVIYKGYDEASLMALLLDGVYVDGQKVDVDPAKITFVTDVNGLPASEATDITIKFAGDETRKPAEATVSIKINKAIVDVKVDSSVIKADQVDWSKHWPVTTNPAGVAKIEFIVGLDIADLSVDTSEGASISAIKGIVGKVQLLLPKDLQDLLILAGDALNAAAGTNLSFANGATMKLSELKAAVSKMEEIFANFTDNKQYQEYFGVLMNMLNSLPTETADVEVTIGGNMPTDIGVYLIGAVSADSNYETNFGVGVVAIYPDGIKADLAWEQEDDNYVITNTLLSTYAFDTSAKVTAVGAGGNIADATAQLAEIFLGVDIEGNITLEMDQTKLNVGAYVEVAMIIDWGNTMYYSMPLVRPIVVVAETLDVDFVDEHNEVNNDRHYYFDTDLKNGMEGNLLITYKQDVNGHAAGDKFVLADGSTMSVKYVYVGVESSGKPYASTSAPTNAGVYTITAIVVVKDSTGYITHAGQGIGALVIEPAKSNTTVDNATYPFGGSHKVNDLVHTESETAKVNEAGYVVDKTVISVGLSADLDTISGLNSINAPVNIDFPVWMDNVLQKLGVLEAAYTDEGITVGTFKSYVEKIKAELTDLGLDVAAFDEITGIVDQLPINTKLTFNSDVAYSEVGVYLVIGVATDFNHYPSVGVGAMVIYPDATEAELHFEEDWNDNNIFTWTALANMNLEAYATVNGVESAEASAHVYNLYLGYSDNGKVVLELVKPGKHIKYHEEFGNGAYTQVAMLLDIDNTPYYAEPIARAFAIIPTPAIIEFVDENGNVNNDRHFIFNNLQHAMDVRVTVNGVVLTDLTGLTVNYTGLQTNGVVYNSSEAPSESGAYVVTATYTAYDNAGRLVTLGVQVGAMVIEPAKAEVEVDNKTHEYDGTAIDTESMIHVIEDVADYTPDTIIITAGINTDGTFSENLLNAINTEINIDLPVWADKVLAEVDGTQDGITVAGVIAAIEKVEAKLAELADKAELDVEFKTFDALKNVLGQLDPTFTVTFNEAPAYKEVGAYLVIGVVADNNFYPAMNAGVLVIYPNMDKAELNWIYEDTNNVFTLDTLSRFDLGAYATVNGVESNEVPFEVLFLGVNTETMEIVLTRDQADLDVGVYTEIAYVLDIGSEMYVAEPIIREVIIVPNVYNVLAEDLTVVYDGMAHAIDPITVLNQFNEDITANGELTVTYMGITAGIEGYMSSNAPTEAGIYEVVITFTTYDNEGNVTGAGSKVVSLVIEKADPVFDLLDTNVVFDGAENFVDMLNSQNVDYAAVIRTEDGINLILTDGLSDLAEYLGDEIYDLTTLKTAIQNAVNAIAGLELDSEFVNELLATIEEVNDSAIYKISVNGTNPIDAGTYRAFAITVPTANYKLDVSEGTLVIEPKTVTVKVESFDVHVGDAMPTLSYVIVDSEGNEIATDLVVTLTCGTSNTNTAGVYAIEAAVAENDNYVVIIENGELTVIVSEITDLILSGEYVYNGNEQTVDHVVKFNDLVLIEGVDYTIEGHVQTNAGTYTVTVKGIGNFTGKLSKTWTIAPAKITSVEVTSTHIYNGSEQTATIVVKAGDLVLNENEYTVTGNTATDAGTYTVTVTANSTNYAGTVSADWTIEKKQITAADVALDGALTYNGNEQTQKVIVTAGVTYDIAGNTATNAGDYKLTVTANGNYVGSVELDWTIAKKAATITADDKSMVAGNPVPELTVTVDGVVAGETLNYTLSTKNPVAIGEHGTYDIVVTLGKNPNYDVTVVNGTLTAEECALTVDGVAYTGWAEAMADIHNGVSEIKLYKDVRYYDAKDKNQTRFPSNSDITLDLNGYELRIYGTLTLNPGTDLNVVGGGALTMEAKGWPLVLSNNNTVVIADDVAFAGLIQMNNKAKSNYYIGNECIIGNSADALFQTTGDSNFVTVKFAAGFMDLNLQNGHLTLTKDLETLDGQKVKVNVGNVRAPARLTIDAGKTLTVHPGTELVIEGTVDGEGTIAVSSVEHLAQALATDVANVKLMADAEDTTVDIVSNGDVTLDLNGHKMTANSITVNGNMTVVDNKMEDKKPATYEKAGSLLGDITVNGTLTLFAGTYSEDVNAYVAQNQDLYARDNKDGTWTVITTYICWNADDKEYFNDLETALAKADAGETVEVLVEEISESLVYVRAGTTLDLNGNYVIADYVFAVGQVVDSAEEVGGLKISNTAKVVLPENNEQLPLYDVDAKCYRFFEYELEYFAQREGTNAITYAYTIRFENADAYELLQKYGSDTGLKVSHYLHWDKLGDNVMEYEYTSDLIKKFATKALEALEAGSGTPVLTYKVTGLSVVSGQTLDSSMVLSSVTGVASDDVAPSYDVP